MRLELDPQADAAYVWLRELPYAFGEDLDHERRIDYAADRQPIGVELLNVSRGVNVSDLPRATEIEQLLREHNIQTLAAR